MYAFHWTTADDYSREYAETLDPRVCLVIERQNEWDALPDGDAFAPSYWVEYRGGYAVQKAGSTFDDDGAADALALAWNTWGRDSDTARRYLSIFHGVTYETMQMNQGGDTLALLDTPAHRAACGAPASVLSSDFLEGDRDTWAAIRDGEVYGIGYAVNPARVTTETPVDLDADGWTVELECFGFYGESWAKEAAAEGDYGYPTLPPMLDLPAVA